MDSEICTSCGRKIPLNSVPVVRDGRVICPDCAILEAAQDTAPAKQKTAWRKSPRSAPPAAAAPKKQGGFMELQAASRWTPRGGGSRNPEYKSALDILWVALYIAGLFASVVALHNASLFMKKGDSLVLNLHGMHGTVTTLPFGMPIMDGPYRITFQQCHVQSGGSAGANGGTVKQISIVLQIHNSTDSRTLHYKSWRSGGVRSRASKDINQHSGIISDLEFWRKKPSGNKWVPLAANPDIPGFPWTACFIKPHGTVYDVLKLTVNSRHKAVPILLAAKNLGQKGYLVLRSRSDNVGVLSPSIIALLNSNLQTSGEWTTPFPAVPIPHPLPVVVHFPMGGFFPPARPPGAVVHFGGPKNPAGAFNPNRPLRGPGTAPLPFSTVVRWTAKPDPPRHPLRINLHGHVIIHQWLEPFYSSPQGYFLGGQANYLGRFQHYYLANLRSPSWHMVFSTPMAMVTQAMVSPNGAYVAYLDTPQVLNAGPQLPGTIKHELALWSHAGDRIQWHQTFHGQSPYTIVGFSAADNLLIRSTDRFATTFYKLSAKTGSVMLQMRVSGHYHMPSVCISPGGHYLAAFNHNGLHVWNVSTGKLAGLSRPSLTINRYQVNNRLAFSNNGHWLGAALPDNRGGLAGFKLLMWNVSTGKLAAYALYSQKSNWNFQEPAANCFGCLGPAYGWQIGLKLIDSKTGRLYHRFANPVQNKQSIDSQSTFAWMPDPRHLVFSATAGAQWGYMVLKADPAIMAKQLASVRAGARRNDWKLGPLKTAVASTCNQISLPDAPPSRWSFKVKEPAIDTSPVPVRVIRTRLLTIPQGGTGHVLRIDSVRFAGAQSRMALVAYRQLTTVGLQRETALWIDRVNLRSGSIRGSFASPNPRAHLLDFGTDGHTMLMATGDTLDIYRWPKAGPPKRIAGWRIGMVAGQLIQGNITHGRLLPGQQVLTMSVRGNVVIWSIPDHRAESTFLANSSIAPVTDAAHKLLAFTSFNGVYLINLTGGELIGPLKGPVFAAGPLSFSPGGTHLAMLCGTADLAIWNLHTGAFRGQFAPQIHVKPAVPGVPVVYHSLWPGNSLQWLNGRYVLTNGRIFDLQNHRILRQLKSLSLNYSAINAIKRSYDHRCWTLESNGHNWLLVGVRLPTGKMLTQSKALGPAKLLLKTGDAISVKIGSGDFIGAEQQYLAAARRGLRHQGFAIRRNQPLVMTISCRPSATQTQTYGQGLFGQRNPVTVSLAGRLVRWRLRKSGKIIWQSQVFYSPSLPGFLPPEATANPQAFLTTQFNRRFTTQIQIPRLPQDIFPTDAAGAPVSVIGPHGLMSQNQSRFFRLSGLRH